MKWQFAQQDINLGIHAVFGGIGSIGVKGEGGGSGQEWIW